jgi:hypothetical protein
MDGSRLMQKGPASGGYKGPVPVVPIALSIVGVIAWLVFILFYALDWSSHYSLFQNLIVTVVSFLIAGLIIGLMWMPWFRLSGDRR